MRPYLDDGDVVLHLGDCVEVMREMDAESVDAIVTDPPYGLEFMGKEWDGANGFRRSLNPADVGRDDVFGRSSRTSPEYRAGRLFGEWCETWATEALRVLRPGGFLLAFGGTRTYHRLTCAIEDAGFEVRDCLVWLHGVGFPKSRDVSKAIDAESGRTRERVPYTGGIAPGSGNYGGGGRVHVGTKTGDEPVSAEAAEWQGWGTALKPAHEPVVVARKPLAERTVAAQVLATGTGALNIDGCRVEGVVPQVTQGVSRSRSSWDVRDAPTVSNPHPSGRWPANVALDEDAARALDEAVGSGPSRFFYTAKASRDERDGSGHPTVKPLALMRWLVRLVTPPGGVVLDPFAGSGTTLLAARQEGFRGIGIEREPEYAAMAAHRLRQLSLFGGAA